MLDLSIEEMQRAWERVQENEGCAGADGVRIEDFAAGAASLLPELLKQAEDGSYRALPLRKIVIAKRTGKTRTLLVPAVRDRILQTAVARKLSRSFEEEFLEASYAYRPSRGVDRAVARILQLRERGWEWVVDTDIRSYFDRVNHKLLLEALAREEGTRDCYWVLKQWVKASGWDGRQVFAIRRGIPQGSPISPLLANFYLTPFDAAMERGENRLIRYADDLLILCKSREEADAALGAAGKLMKQAGLELHPDKTRIVRFAEGFEYLGVRFRDGEAMVPWKWKGETGKLVFLARPMPQQLLRKYRKEAAQAVLPTEAPARVERETRALAGGKWMPFLYVMEQGAILRKSGDRFLVEHDQQIVADLPYHRLEQILLFGNVQATSQAMAEALDKGIGLSLFTRNGRFRGTLSPAAGKDVELRIAQYRLYDQDDRSLPIARAVVRQKIRNGLEVLQRYEDRDRETDQTLEARGTMERALEEAEKATSREELDGYEGAAAKAYFGALMSFNRSEFQWEGRVKHPATDPLNALLSLAYTMVMHELSALIEASGLDPGLGFLHEADGSRPSLALDLMEPFRHPAADRFVLTAVNRGIFGKQDFERRDDHGGLVLDPRAMRKFFEQYEQWMLAGAGKEGDTKLTFRRCLQMEVERFRKMVKEGGEWQPFAWPMAGGE